MQIDSYKPLVSVITVTLNCKDHFVSTAESIKSQNYENLEFIVVDGGSSDGTKESLMTYRDIITNYLSEADDGIYDAMNKGIKLCSSSSVYALFLNAGDLFYDNRTVSRAMKYAGTFSEHLYGDIYRDNSLVKSVDKVNAYTLSTNMICHQAIFFRMETLRVFAYDTAYKLCSDYKLLVELIKAGERFRYLGKPVTKFEGTGVSSKQRELLRFEKKEIRSQYPLLRFWNFLKTRAAFFKR